MDWVPDSSKIGPMDMMGGGQGDNLGASAFKQMGGSAKRFGELGGVDKVSSAISW